MLQIYFICFSILQEGISVIDSSAAGLGGCPYAKTTAGNVCSETVLYMLNELNIDTGVDLEKLRATGNWISAEIGRKSLSILEH